MKMRMHLIFSKKGMTLAEVMMATAYGIFFLATLMAFSSFFFRAHKEYMSDVELTNDARLIIEKMVWGNKVAGQANRRGIIEAVAGNIISGTQFRYSDINGTQHTLRLNNGNVEYQAGSTAPWITLLDANGSAVNDPAKYSMNLSFVQPTVANSVVIRVVVGKNILGQWHYGSTTTQVFYRNA